MTDPGQSECFYRFPQTNPQDEKRQRSPIEDQQQLDSHLLNQPYNHDARNRCSQLNSHA